MNLTRITRVIAIAAILCNVACAIIAAVDRDWTETLAWSLVVLLHATMLREAIKKS